MLVLTRRLNQSIMIGDPKNPEECIEVTVIEIRGDQVRIGTKAPRDVVVHRREIYDEIAAENAVAFAAASMPGALEPAVESGVPSG